MTLPTDNPYHARILKVMLHIQQYLDRPLPLKALAEIAHFSPYHFHRIFRAISGETVAVYIRRLRLERAATELRYTSLSIGEIAARAGFEAAEAFSRAFKKHFGLSPQQFRQAATTPQIPGSCSGVAYQIPQTPIEFTPKQGNAAMSLDVEIIDADAMILAYLRHTGPYMEVLSTFERVLNLAEQYGLFGPDTQVVMLSHDDPNITDEDKLRADAGVTIADPKQPVGELLVRDVPGGLYAKAIHIGPYEQLKESFDWLYGQWLPNSGYEVDDRPCVELYPNSPEDTPAEELITEIRIPVRKP